ncbi:amidohydrolase [Pyrococcus abyssi]|uniref:AepA exoenzymes regulatory protein aepa n=1 Tax=Pyrococcus abyssi (strain GE5 / Orsay) TaxID=272844 RepID=Q9UZR9_PYRAB|nr:amidohydrolase [Pyrococcus abyssi]CAB49987.1 aepA exoenzymes regulatory protein aepa precursor [Pyrococcus abyssi GE5]CCE70487.1 TPA: exoenzyme regulatory protein aepa precursor [Pyrococcus abyssi GE5]
MKALINGNIYTSFRPLRKVSGLVISNDRVVYAGDSSVAKRIVELSGGEVIDLKGKYVMPAFFDSHLHLDELGMSLEMVDLRGTKSMKELLERLKGGKGRIIFGFGWDQDELGEYPTKEVLNEIDKPVFIYRKCFHVAVANDAMLELLNLEPSKDFEEDTGMIKEKALEEARKIINEKILSLEDYIHYIERAQEHLINLGVKSVAFMSVNEKAFKALFYLEREGKLKVNVSAYINPSILDKLEDLNLRRFNGERLSITGVKLFTDGSFGARTALLSEPYSDDPSTSGEMVSDEEELANIMERAKRLKLDVAVHAIGDRGLDIALNAFEKAKLSGRVEHASLVRDDQLERIRELGIRLSVQPHFIISDWWVVERVGEKRARWVYRFKDLLRVAEVGFSTDAPIEPADPWLTVEAAVNRGKGVVKLYEFTKDQALTVEEALHCYTYGSARVSLANDIGKLEPGFKAEYIVMDRDPLVMK